MIGLLIALCITLCVGFLIVKKIQPQAVLFFAGILLMLITIFMGNGERILGSSSTGIIFFDIFEVIKSDFSANGASLGLTIMAIGGFASLMDKVGASKILVEYTVKPLRLLNAPYVVLALGTIIGMLLKMFVPSASGLGLLLMVTLYPIIVELGASKLSATAVIATSTCLDIGPASGATSTAASYIGMDTTDFFLTYQLKVSLVCIAVLTVLNFIVQSSADKKMGHVAKAATPAEIKSESAGVPKIYAVLPVIPLLLLFGFSQPILKALGISNIKSLNVITAMIFTVFLTLIFEVVRQKSLKTAFSQIVHFFKGMGNQWASVVTLIVAGQTFARGLESIGAIDAIIQAAKSANMGIIPMTLIMVVIITVCSIIMGSGNAPFYSFGELAPKIAADLGVPSAAGLMVLPMQLSSSIARTVSPITAVIVAVSGISELDTVDVIKRTAIPMLGTLITMLICTFLFCPR